MYKYKTNFFILTGGPGAGKTTLIQALDKHHYHTVGESGRSIIREQMKNAGDALPWKDKALFSRHMLQADIHNYHLYEPADTPVIFDRGIPDVLGYIRLSNISSCTWAALYAENYRYNTTVFILPPWKEIYHHDIERKQDFKLALYTYKMMHSTYKALGYLLVEVPRIPVVERARMIIEHIQAKI